MRTFLILFIILIFSSCAKNPKEQAAEAIDIALTHLSSRECDEAIRVLEDVDDQEDNAIYIQVLASAYACKAEYDEISFLLNDLADVDTTSPATIMTSLAIMSLSDETAVDSDNYVAIRTGLDLIHGSTTGSPSQVARNNKFGSRKGGDLGVQALLLTTVNLGKFLNFYGNVNAAGAKSLGTNTNSCFINYTDPRAQLVIGGGAGGVCNANNDGHPDLSFAPANLENAKRRLCEGLMLITNLLDILDNLDLSGSSDLSKLESISTQVETFRTAATAAGLGTLIGMTSQSACETAMDTQSNLDDMEYLYSIMFETGLQ